MTTCRVCANTGLEFSSEYYSPEDFLHGKRSSRIWIVGINPKKEKDKLLHNRKIDYLVNYFNNKENIHPYFNDFKRVSMRLYNLLGEENGAAHTDIVKCFSKKTPPSHCFDKCKEYIVKQLENQLRFNLLPKIIICNGAPVCDVISNILNIKTRKQRKKENDKLITSDIGNFHDNQVTVIYSGFIGRIDDYSKIRLGKEIEKYMDIYGIGITLKFYCFK